jgi:PKD repeat protein
MIRGWIRLVSEENMWKSSLWLFVLAAWVLCGACLLDNPEAPELAGPSTAARSITIRAIPDAIVSDGFSSSVIEAVMHGPNGELVSGATILFEIQAGGLFLDLGNLAPLNGPRPLAGGVEAGPVSDVTDGDGVARARYWAPFRTDQENDTTVTIAARESGTNSRGANFAQADIFLRAANRPSFPGTGACGFIVEPQDVAYKVGDQIFFTATQLTGATLQPIARYEWDFGDNSARRSGRDSGHVYTSANSYTVTLFTTESISGNQENCTKVLDVTAGGGAPPTTTTVPACSTPTATFTPSGICSSGEIIADGATAASFDASASSGGGAGETITSYSWTFGDGGTSTGSLVSHTYAAALAGFSVTVSLTVTNSCGATDASSDTFDLISPPCP